MTALQPHARTLTPKASDDVLAVATRHPQIGMAFICIHTPVGSMITIIVIPAQ